MIIAEKKSVGETIAKVVGASDKQSGYIEGDNYIVSWARGHLIALEEPDFYGYKDWKLSTLPMVPNKWAYYKIEYREEEKEKTKNSNAAARLKQIDVLEKLFNREDVSSLICAGDAGREGELIFRWIYYKLGCKKPFERLWISSLEESAIREGMENLRPSSEFDNLYASAVSRAWADWIFGYNGTRLYSIINPVVNTGATSVGRVQTPTLNMIIERQKEIDTFQKQTKYHVVKKFGEAFKLETEGFENKKDAEICKKETEEHDLCITEINSQQKKFSPPLLYSLSTLQQDANKKFGYSASDTLLAAQNLYEKKLLSYPRTVSNYITEDMIPITSKIIEMLIAKEKILEGKSSIVDRVSRVANNSKVLEGHYALVCTYNYAKNGTANAGKLSDQDLNILNLVKNRMIVAVGYVRVVEETSVKGLCNSYEFHGSGKQIIAEGWKEFDRLLNPEEEIKRIENHFPSDMQSGSTYGNSVTEIESRTSKPKSPYTEAELLKEMERAGVEQMEKDTEKKGIGTPATRAEIIETLIARGYIIREEERAGKKRKSPFLIPTKAGRELINVVNDDFKNVRTTADWENRLLQIERGSEHFKIFIEDVKNKVGELVKKEEENFFKSNVLGPCPVCGSPVADNGEHLGFVECPSCSSRWYKTSFLHPSYKLKDRDLSLLFQGKKVKIPLTFKSTNRTEIKDVSLDFEKTKNEKRLCYTWYSSARKQ